MNRKRGFGFLILGILTLSILSVSFVSAGFFDKFRITAHVTLDDDGWTSWLNRDGPGGSGDWETLTDFVNSGQACENPYDIEYQAVNGEETSQNIHVGNTLGFYCLNSENPEGCLDYEIRFKCSEKVSYCDENECYLREGDKVYPTFNSNEVYLVKINFISSEEVKLEVNGENLPLLSEGESYLFGEVKFSINDIFYDTKDTGISAVSFEFKKISEEVPVCGNGVVEGAEKCDDGNTLSGDGCSITCTVESGWTCSETPSICLEEEEGGEYVCSGISTYPCENYVGSGVRDCEEYPVSTFCDANVGIGECTPKDCDNFTSESVCKTAGCSWTPKENASVSCIDSDGGENYYVKGSAIWATSDESFTFDADTDKSALIETGTYFNYLVRGTSFKLDSSGKESVTIQRWHEGLNSWQDIKVDTKEGDFVSLSNYEWKIDKIDKEKRTVSFTSVSNNFIFSLGGNDFCQGDDIIEFTCGDKESRGSFSDYNCPNGCSNGACIEDESSIPKGVLDVFENAEILWGHSGKSGSEECKEQLNATCVSSVISYRQFIDGDETWIEKPVPCDTIYKRGENLNEDGERLNAITCARAEDESQQKILDLFENAQTISGEIGKSGDDVCGELDLTCISSIHSQRSYTLYYPEGDIIDVEYPVSCDLVFSNSSSSDSYKMENHVVCVDNDFPQKISDSFNNADIYLGHSGISCSQECINHDLTCISNGISFVQSQEGNWVWAEIPQTCDTIYDGRGNSSAEGQRANYCLCAKEKDIAEKQGESSCENNYCILYEGENISVGDYPFKIFFIGSNQVRFSVNGKNTPLMNVGSSYSVDEFLKVSVNDIQDSFVSFSYEFAGSQECVGGCFEGEKCYPLGYRKSGMYCSEEGEFANQFNEDFTCDNNFECSSNLCVDGQCISSSLMQKFLKWFRNLFIEN